MSVRVFRQGGEEIDLKSSRLPSRILGPFDQGFHEAVQGKATEDNPFPLDTTAAEEWDSGWKVYMDRKKNMRWSTLEDCTPEGADAGERDGTTWLCLVKDKDGYYLHKPCAPKFVGWELKLVWVDYHGQVGVNVVEFAHVQMKNPQLVNAMQARQDWTAVAKVDLST